MMLSLITSFASDCPAVEDDHVAAVDHSDANVGHAIVTRESNLGIHQLWRGESDALIGDRNHRIAADMAPIGARREPIGKPTR